MKLYNVKQINETLTKLRKSKLKKDIIMGTTIVTLVLTSCSNKQEVVETSPVIEESMVMPAFSNLVPTEESTTKIVVETTTIKETELQTKPTEIVTEPETSSIEVEEPFESSIEAEVESTIEVKETNTTAYNITEPVPEIPLKFNSGAELVEFVISVNQLIKEKVDNNCLTPGIDQENAIIISGRCEAFRYFEKDIGGIYYTDLTADEAKDFNERSSNMLQLLKKNVKDFSISVNNFFIEFYGENYNSVKDNYSSIKDNTKDIWDDTKQSAKDTWQKIKKSIQ